MPCIGSLPGRGFSSGASIAEKWARLAKCRQISIFAMPVAFTGKYREIMENTGKYDLQPSTFRMIISIIEDICLNTSFLLVNQTIS